MNRDELIEVIAWGIALEKARYTAGADPDEELIKTHYELPSTMRNAKAALQAIEDAGRVVVPREPTEKMVEIGAVGIAVDGRGYGIHQTAGSHMKQWELDARASYTAMIEAARQA